MRIASLAASLALSLGALAHVANAADPWADVVVQYTQGGAVGSDWVTSEPFTNPLTAIGQPTRVAGTPESFGTATTPFSSAYRSYEIVSIGAGGSLTLQFSEPVIDHPLNPYGIDLLIFGNSFYSMDFGAGTATGPIDANVGVIEVSANGVDYVPVTGGADGKFPTVGYLDTTDPFAPTAGAVLSDFTKPVNPAALASVAGLNTAQIISAYDGSGGGSGIDLAGSGLSSISFVRISNPAGSLRTIEIDALADVRAVPEPTTITLIAMAATGIAGLRRRQRQKACSDQR
jgi:hypothetical protein